VPDNRIAIGFVASKRLKRIINITVIGTQSIIPTTPQTKPQKASDRKTTNELMLRELPINLGSIKFPTIS